MDDLLELKSYIKLIYYPKNYFSSLRRADQSTVFCIVSFDFNWSRSPKIRHPFALVCHCGLPDIRRFFHIKTDHQKNWWTFLVEFFGINRLWGLFLEGPEKFSHPESYSKISNLVITELFYSYILNMNKGSLHTKISTSFCFEIQINWY